MSIETAMDRPDTAAVLNEMLQILCRSLPMYLRDARPWSRRDQRQAQTAIDSLVADQQMYAERLAQHILEEDGRPDPGVFPIEFTAIHDLALDYLLQEVVERQRHDLAVLRRCAAELAPLPAVRALAEEIVGNTQGYLEILEGLGARGEG
jgi:hypothetical protein